MVAPVVAVGVDVVAAEDVVVVFADDGDELPRAGATFNGYAAVYSYTGMTSLGALQTSSGTGTSPSLSATAANSTDIIWGTIVAGNNDNFSAFSLTQRQTETGALYSNFIAGDTTGATSETVSATIGSTPWAVAALDLQ